MKNTNTFFDIYTAKKPRLFSNKTRTVFFLKFNDESARELGNDYFGVSQLAYFDAYYRSESKAKKVADSLNYFLNEQSWVKRAVKINGKLGKLYCKHDRDEKWARKVLHSPRLQKKGGFNFIPHAFEVFDKGKEEY